MRISAWSSDVCSSDLAIAARRFGVPIAIVSIVDTDRIWFKSHHGLPVQQIDREPGLCASALLPADPHILEDATIDPRALPNPLVPGEFGLLFYVRVPLTTSAGFRLVTLCVISKEAPPLSKALLFALDALATLVMDHLGLSFHPLH